MRFLHRGFTKTCYFLDNAKSFFSFTFKKVLLAGKFSPISDRKQTGRPSICTKIENGMDFSPSLLYNTLNEF